MSRQVPDSLFCRAQFKSTVTITREWGEDSRVRAFRGQIRYSRTWLSALLTDTLYHSLFCLMPHPIRRWIGLVFGTAFDGTREVVFCAVAVHEKDG